MRLRLIAFGVVCGELIGLSRLVSGHSVDVAVAAGIIGVVAVTVGIWIGAVLALKVLEFTRSRISAAQAVVSQVADVSIPDESGSILDEEAQTPSRFRLTRIVGWSLIALPTLLLIISPVPTLFVVLDMGLALFNLEFWRPAALWVGLVTAMSLAIQQLLIWVWVQALTRLAHTVHTAPPVEHIQDRTARHEAQVRRQVQDCRQVARTAPGWVERVTGISASRMGSDGYSGSPA